MFCVKKYTHECNTTTHTHAPLFFVVDHLLTWQVYAAYRLNVTNAGIASEYDKKRRTLVVRGCINRIDPDIHIHIFYRPDR